MIGPPWTNPPNSCELSGPVDSPKGDNCSDYGLAPNIIWNNDDTIYLLIYASPGLKELKTVTFNKTAHLN